MSSYLSKDEVLGFLANDESEKEVSGSDWISTNDGKEVGEEIFSYVSSSEAEMDAQLCSSACANYFVFKTETGQSTPFANNAGRAAAHNVIRQNPGPTRFAKSQCSEISDTFTLFLRSFRKTTVYVSGIITKEPQHMAAHGNP